MCVLPVPRFFVLSVTRYHETAKWATPAQNGATFLLILSVLCRFQAQYVCKTAALQLLKQTADLPNPPNLSNYLLFVSVRGRFRDGSEDTGTISQSPTEAPTPTPAPAGCACC